MTCPDGDLGCFQGATCSAQYAAHNVQRAEGRGNAKIGQRSSDRGGKYRTSVDESLGARRECPLLSCKLVDGNSWGLLGIPWDSLFGQAMSPSAQKRELVAVTGVERGVTVSSLGERRWCHWLISAGPTAIVPWAIFQYRRFRECYAGEIVDRPGRLGPKSRGQRSEVRGGDRSPP